LVPIATTIRQPFRGWGLSILDECGGNKLGANIATPDATSCAGQRSPIYSDPFAENHRLGMGGHLRVGIFEGAGVGVERKS
jgi:hypothetical protein